MYACIILSYTINVSKVLYTLSIAIHFTDVRLAMKPKPRCPCYIGNPTEIRAEIAQVLSSSGGNW